MGSISRQSATASISSVLSQPCTSCTMRNAAMHADRFCSTGYWPPNDRYACVSRLKADRPCVVLPPSSVHFSKYDVLRANDRHHVGEHMAARHFVQRCNMGVTRRAYLHAEGFVGAVGNEIHAELALGMLHRRIGLARRHAVTFGEKLEVMNQRFHIGLHDFALGRHHFG